MTGKPDTAAKPKSVAKEVAEEVAAEAALQMLGEAIDAIATSKAGAIVAETAIAVGRSAADLGSAAVDVIVDVVEGAADAL